MGNRMGIENVFYNYYITIYPYQSHHLLVSFLGLHKLLYHFDGKVLTKDAIYKNLIQGRLY